MHTSRSAGELTIQETPGCLWFIGAFFSIIGGAFVYGALGGFTNWNEASFWQILLTFFMGSFGVGVGFWTIHKAPISKLVIDRVDEKIYLTRRRLFQRSETIYAFDEVDRFRLIEELDDENSPIWFFGMDLSDGETIAITSLASHTEEFQQKYVFEANEFARKMLATYENLVEIEEPID